MIEIRRGRRRLLGALALLVAAGVPVPAHAYTDTWTSEEVVTGIVSSPALESGTAEATILPPGGLSATSNVAEQLPVAIPGRAGSVTATAMAFVEERFSPVPPGLRTIAIALQVPLPGSQLFANLSTIQRPICTSDVGSSIRCAEARVVFDVFLRWCDATGCTPRGSFDASGGRILACRSADVESDCFGGRFSPGPQTLGVSFVLPAGKTGFEVDAGLRAVSSVRGGGLGNRRAEASAGAVVAVTSITRTA